MHRPQSQRLTRRSLSVISMRQLPRGAVTKQPLHQSRMHRVTCTLSATLANNNPYLVSAQILQTAPLLVADQIGGFTTVATSFPGGTFFGSATSTQPGPVVVTGYPFRTPCP